MKKWKYLFVTCDFHKHSYRPRYINDEEIDEWKEKTTISEFANHKGSEGWEMILANHKAQEYIFKRESPILDKTAAK